MAHRRHYIAFPAQLGTEVVGRQGCVSLSRDGCIVPVMRHQLSLWLTCMYIACDESSAVSHADLQAGASGG